VTLGSSGLIAQWMAGMTLIYSRAMRQGDLVKAGDNEGVVILVGLLSTKIRTATFEEITIPNSSLISGSIRNFTRLSEGLGSRVTTTVTIGYDAPWRQVHALLLEAAARTEGLRTEPPPFVLQRALSDFYVEYELVGRIDAPLDRPYIMTRLHANVQDLFNEYGVQILSPHYMTQPAEPVVVDRRNWYAAPAKPDKN
jgi:small-conductance mechanosensitive channel